MHPGAGAGAGAGAHNFCMQEQNEFKLSCLLISDVTV